MEYTTRQNTRNPELIELNKRVHDDMWAQIETLAREATRDVHV